MYTLYSRLAFSLRPLLPRSAFSAEGKRQNWSVRVRSWSLLNNSRAFLQRSF